MSVTSLYRHFDKNGRLLYVGISLRHTQRLSEHRRSSHWYFDISSITVAHYPSRMAAERAERRAIRTENPLHNVRRAAPRPIRSDVVDAIINAPVKVAMMYGDEAYRGKRVRGGLRKMAYLRLVGDEDIDGIAYDLSKAGVNHEYVFVDDANSSDRPMWVRLMKTAQHEGTVIYCQRKASFWPVRHVLRKRGIRLDVIVNGDLTRIEPVADHSDMLRRVASAQNVHHVRQAKRKAAKKSR